MYNSTLDQSIPIIRTKDVKIDDNITFHHLHLPQPILEGLTNHGFEKPSPIQLKAIPLGRCGLDLIVEAKSGTGKTAVFSIIALDLLEVKQKCLQILILAPTREIALQICHVIKSLGSQISGLKVGCIIGGIATKYDKNDHILVATPGRLKNLIEKKLIDVNNIRLFVLDEADKLMDVNFRAVIHEIITKLPENKQVISTSATYPDDLKSDLMKYMRSPSYVSPYNDPILIGVRQYVKIVSGHPNQMKQIQLKTMELTKILSQVPFKQCLVFLNYQTRVQSVCNNINKLGFSATYITGNQDMTMRIEALKKLVNFECKILLSTDLTARGIDADNVNLIINYDIPHDCATYLHRIGRAGRYGSYGIAINLVAENEKNIFNDMVKPLAASGCSFLYKLPDYMKNIWSTDAKEFEEYCKSDVDDLVTSLSDEIYSKVKVNGELGGGQSNNLKSTLADVRKNCIELETTFKNDDSVNGHHTLDNNLMAVNSIHLNPQLPKKSMTISDFIDKIYEMDEDILDKRKKNISDVQTVGDGSLLDRNSSNGLENNKISSEKAANSRETLKILYKNSSVFQTLNENSVFNRHFDVTNLAEKHDVDGNEYDIFMNYSEFKNSNECCDEKSQDLRADSLINIDIDEIQKSVDLSNSDLIECYENLVINIDLQPIFNVENDTLKIPIRHLKLWDNILADEIQNVKNLLSKKIFYVNDSGRKLLHNKYWKSLKAYFEFQKEFFSIFNSRFCDEYYQIKIDENFKSSNFDGSNLEKDIFPKNSLEILQLLADDNHFAKIQHEKSTEDYYKCVSIIRSHPYIHEKLMKLKEQLFDLSIKQRDDLEKSLESQQIKKNSSSSFYLILEGIQEQKENRTKRAVTKKSTKFLSDVDELIGISTNTEFNDSESSKNYNTARRKFYKNSATEVQKKYPSQKHSEEDAYNKIKNVKNTGRGYVNINGGLLNNYTDRRNENNVYSQQFIQDNQHFSNDVVANSQTDFQQFCNSLNNQTNSFHLQNYYLLALNNFKTT